MFAVCQTDDDSELVITMKIERGGELYRVVMKPKSEVLQGSLVKI